jgi:hypothetical protein
MMIILLGFVQVEGGEVRMLHPFLTRLKPTALWMSGRRLAFLFLSTVLVMRGYVVAERFTSDVCDLQACNQCLCGVWVRSQLAALDKLHHIKGIFGANHVPVVSSGHSGFLHHQN